MKTWLDFLCALCVLRGKVSIRCAVALVALAQVFLATSAFALEFRSVAEDAAVLYDAPSLKARKLYVLSRHYPVEVVVNLDKWAKVRDRLGELAWIEKKDLSDKRYVVVTVPLADVRKAADDSAPVIFQAQQNVAMELVEPAVSGWIKVLHRDGQSGYVKTTQAWGG